MLQLPRERPPVKGMHFPTRIGQGELCQMRQLPRQGPHGSHVPQQRRRQVLSTAPAFKGQRIWWQGQGLWWQEQGLWQGQAWLLRIGGRLAISRGLAGQLRLAEHPRVASCLRSSASRAATGALVDGSSSSLLRPLVSVACSACSGSSPTSWRDWFLELHCSETTCCSGPRARDNLRSLRNTGRLAHAAGSAKA